MFSYNVWNDNCMCWHLHTKNGTQHIVAFIHLETKEKALLVLEEGVQCTQDSDGNLGCCQAQYDHF